MLAPIQTLPVETVTSPTNRGSPIQNVSPLLAEATRTVSLRKFRCHANLRSLPVRGLQSPPSSPSTAEALRRNPEALADSWWCSVPWRAELWCSRPSSSAAADSSDTTGHTGAMPTWSASVRGPDRRHLPVPNSEKCATTAVAHSVHFCSPLDSRNSAELNQNCISVYHFDELV